MYDSTYPIHQLLTPVAFGASGIFFLSTDNVPVIDGLRFAPVFRGKNVNTTSTFQGVFASRRSQLVCHPVMSLPFHPYILYTEAKSIGAP